ncbi:MAG TPA: hypothetical protein PLJ60_01890 [Chryseolinea sp.]|nr:hypothetical protein [Chryseolinea sp.]
MNIAQSFSKIKWLANMLLLLFALTFVQCSDDESPALTFTIDGVNFNLKNAKIYLGEEDTYNGYTYRDYFISDGIPTNNSPWSIDEYSVATFMIVIELGTKSADGLSSGDFPSIYDWGEATDDNISYVYSEVATVGGVRSYHTPEDDPTPTIKASGKFDNFGKITVSFDGNLTDDDTEELVPSKLYFSGKIIAL